MPLVAKLKSDDALKGNSDVVENTTPDNDIESKIKNGDINIEGANSRSRSLGGDQQQHQQAKRTDNIMENIVEGTPKYQPHQQPVAALASGKINVNDNDNVNDNRRSSSSINLGDQKSTYGRLRVLAAPPIQTQCGHEGSDFDAIFCGNDSSSTPKAVICPRDHIFGMTTTTATIPPAHRRSMTSTNLRPSSSGAGSATATGSVSTQRLSGGSGGGVAAVGSITAAKSSFAADHSVTQFALIDDENVSALQQVTKGGGALTLASQWKSQFDDSEDTTDNEWKQEPQVNQTYSMS